MAGPVNIAILADGSRARREFGETSTSAERMGKAFRTAGRVGLAGLAGLAAGATATAAIGLKLAQGAAEDEQGQVRLATALRNTTGARAADLVGVEAWISAQGRALGVTDDELRPALGQLAAATGSVAEAQKLTSLALDISTGRKLKLSAVTKALEKAELGNVGALGKLGVQTKDAEGKTRSLDSITRELAQTYRGQAAKAADTTAGKYARLKLTTDELGESIGSKLIPLGDKLATSLLKKGVPAVDGLWDAFDRNGIDGLTRQFDDLTGIDLAPYLDDVERSVDGVRRILGDLGPTIGDVVRELPPFISPLEILADVLDTTADVLGAIPGPVKEVGVQLGLAALIAPRVTGAIIGTGEAFGVARTQAVGYYSALRYGAASSQQAAVGAAKLATAARTAGGIGGIYALTKGVQDADKATGALYTTLGAAALGASVGGPVGAIIGAGAGGAFSLYSRQTREAKKATEDAAAAAALAKQDYDNLRGSLDDLTGATTARTRATIQDKLEDAGLLAAFAKGGVARRTVVNAILGERDARREVSSFIKKQKDDYAALGVQIKRIGTYGDPLAYDLSNNIGRGKYREAKLDLEAQQKAILKVIDAYNAEGLALKQSVVDQRERGRVLQDYTSLIGKIPEKVITKIDNGGGIEPTLSGIAKVIRQYKIIDGKKIKAIIDVTGVDTSVSQVRRFNESLRATGKTKANTRPYLASLESALRDGKRTVTTGAADLSTILRGGIESARSEGLSGGVGIGSNTKAGFPQGFAGAGALWSEEMRGAVRAAINAGNREAAIASPSRKTAYLGRMMGRGLEVGLAKRRPAAKKQGQDLVAAALAGVTGGSAGIAAAIEKTRALIDKQIAGDLRDSKRGVKDKNRLKALEKASAAERAKVIKGLRDEFTALRRNGVEQDRNAARLGAARDRYRQLVAEAREYAATVRDSFVSYGSVIALGQGNGFANSTQLVDQLKARVEQAKRFADLIRKLTRSGLNKTSLQQLLDAGVEGGLGTAEALAAGGSSAIKQINSLTAELTKAGGDLGTTMAKKFKDAGIQAARGLVAGLEREQKTLDRAGVRIGRSIVREIKRELGIKSPSRVFRKVGEQSMAGLALGLDETYAARLGANVGRGVERGFTRPTLTAFTGGSQGGTQSGTQNQTITVHFTAEQVDRLTRGKELVATINYATSRGAQRVK